MLRHMITHFPRLSRGQLTANSFSAKTPPLRFERSGLRSRGDRAEMQHRMQKSIDAKIQSEGQNATPGARRRSNEHRRRRINFPRWRHLLELGMCCLLVPHLRTKTRKVRVNDKLPKLLITEYDRINLSIQMNLNATMNSNLSKCDQILSSRLFCSGRKF